MDANGFCDSTKLLLCYLRPFNSGKREAEELCWHRFPFVIASFPCPSLHAKPSQFTRTTPSPPITITLWSSSFVCTRKQLFWDLLVLGEERPVIIHMGLCSAYGRREREQRMWNNWMEYLHSNWNNTQSRTESVRGGGEGGIVSGLSALPLYLGNGTGSELSLVPVWWTR